jgi:hypothetical protein
MPFVKKTKQERADTPLAGTPDPTTPITDLKSALADINARSAARQASQNESQKKLDDARNERSKARKSVAGEGIGLYGLASFRNTTGKQTRET